MMLKQLINLSSINTKNTITSKPKLIFHHLLIFLNKNLYGQIKHLIISFSKEKICFLLKFLLFNCCFNIKTNILSLNLYISLQPSINLLSIHCSTQII